MKPIDQTSRVSPGQGPLARVLGMATLLLYALLATVAQASTVLVTDTTLVSGSESAVFTFQAPGPGTVVVQLTNLDWPQPLSSLSFTASSASQLLSSWSDAGLSPSPASFAVAGGGTYFADVMATAGGSLDLGAYSLELTFTPAATPVPLPTAGALLSGGVAGLAGLLLWMRGTRTRPAGSGALPAAS